MEDKFQIRKIDGVTLKNSYFFLGGQMVGGIIMITTPTCTKCKAILANEARLKEILPVGMSVYEFDGSEDGVEVLQDMGLMSAPIILYLGIIDSKKAFQSISSISDLSAFAEGLDSLLDN